jgi:hypothetical protein
MIYRLIHASGPNITDEIRLACVYGIIPQGAEMFYYHQKDEQTIEVYRSNPEFFLYGNIFNGPIGLQKTDEIKFDQKASESISEISVKDSNPPTNSILSKIKSYFAGVK